MKNRFRVSIPRSKQKQVAKGTGPARGGFACLPRASVKDTGEAVGSCTPGNELFYIVKWTVALCIGVKVGFFQVKDERMPRG